MPTSSSQAGPSDTSHDVDRHPIPASPWWRRDRDRLAVLVAVVAPLGVSAVLVPFRASFPNTDAALVLVAVIVGVAANGYRLAGLVAAVSAAAWFDYFLTQPYERFTITRRADIETTVLLALVGAAVTELAVHARRQRRVAVSDAGYLTAIGATTRLVASAATPATVIEQVRVQLTALLELRSCHFERSPLGGLAVLEADGRLRWGDVYWSVDADGMPSEAIELPVTGNEGALGRFVLQPTPATSPPILARQVAAILASQVGVALTQQP